MLNRSGKFAWLTVWRPIIVIGITMVIIRLCEITVRKMNKGNNKWRIENRKYEIRLQ